ncbi:Mitochondrial pyruvate carrier 2 [Rozella allomycis CSF55]|uniref:Mitochondrial pyruvate carrier n=1 Tax=Rozella allomycis (strain CSF55) TaxID=988480 RepID=A0A075AP98_ROZAC|nr:Mitochondrial pyruvate carrier 2 [Rozella allomycis CSF55]|eukprot:EPZ31818.1 Mitochondrial pyruvate carrier 2 [Rozella allomycis CSF55]
MASFQKLWNHPAGPKTIHFWAPAMKWALVVAGLGDLSRPAEKLSVSQNTALLATGLIWSRYSTQIIPVNYSLLLVNLFVGLTGATQLYRIAQKKISDDSEIVIGEMGDSQANKFSKFKSFKWIKLKYKINLLFM